MKKPTQTKKAAAKKQPVNEDAKGVDLIAKYQSLQREIAILKVRIKDARICCMLSVCVRLCRVLFTYRVCVCCVLCTYRDVCCLQARDKARPVVVKAVAKPVDGESDEGSTGGRRRRSKSVLHVQSR